MNLQQMVYQLCNQRGVIPNIPLVQLNPKFISKLQEEFFELDECLKTKNYICTDELADCIIVLLNCATANGIDVEQIVLDKATKDVSRKS